MVNQFFVLNTDAAAAVTLQQQIDSVRAHTGRQNTVVRAWGTAALDVTQNGRAGFAFGFGFDVLRQLVNVTDVLGDSHDRVFFTFRDARFDFSHQIFTAKFDFRHDDKFATARNGCRQRQVATVTAHHFNDRDTPVRRRGVTQTVNRFNNGTQCSKEADRVVSTFDVVVDGARQTDAREAHFGQTFCTHVGTVTADNHQRVQAAFLHVFDSHFANVFITEFREACRAEESTATVDHVRHAVTVELNHTIFIQAQITVINAKNFQAFRQRCTDNTTNCRVHARRITAACQHTDFLNHDYL